MMRKSMLIAVWLLTAASASACDADDLPGLSPASSHIEQNVPAPADFDPFLRRDLSAYFQGATVEYELLRDAPTQSGVAYPKYYAWVRVLNDGRLKGEGAVRLAAIERSHFEVTDYLPQSAIVSEPDSVGAIFPAALVPIIQTRANR